MEIITLNNSDDNGPYIELVNYVKLQSKFASGGQARVLIKSGHVAVNNNIEMRAKKKLRKGDLVSIDGQGFMV